MSTLAVNLLFFAEPLSATGGVFVDTGLALPRLPEVRDVHPVSAFVCSPVLGNGSWHAEVLYRCNDFDHTKHGKELLEIMQTVGGGSLSQQWYSPHARSMAGRMVTWTLMNGGWPSNCTFTGRLMPDLSFLPLRDPISMVNEPAILAMDDRVSFTTLRLIKAIPALMHGLTFADSFSDLGAAMETPDPFMRTEDVLTVWLRLCIGLSSFPSCHTIAT